MADHVVALQSKAITGKIKGKICSCRWGSECEALNKAFKDKGEKLRGKTCIRLDLTGETENKI